MAPAKKGPNKVLIAAVIIVVVVVVVAAIGMMMLNASANVKNTAQQMTFKQTDFPTGWHTSGTAVDPPEYEDIEWAYTVYNNSATGTSFEEMAEVSSQIYLYNSVADAKADFTDMLENADTLTLTEVSGHFDQCRVWVLDYGSITTVKMYVFQEKNVCGIIAFSSVWGYDMDQEWIDEMLDLQESRIV